MTVPRKWWRTLAQTGACALLVLCAATAVRAQATADAKDKAQILKQLEQQATAYQVAIAKTPIEVRETIRRYDKSGHLKSTRHSSYRYSSPLTDAGSAKGKGGASVQGNDAPGGAILSDGVTLPLLFLPGSVIHLSTSLETPPSGPWIVHFKSDPCPEPDIHAHWLGANIVSQCVEGDAYVNPSDGALMRIRMNMGGLPFPFRTISHPFGAALLELYNDSSFRSLESGTDASPSLVPEKSEYVTYTTHDRTVVDQTFEPAAAGPQAAPAPRSPGSRRVPM
jgi:hypothetical protein